MGQISTVEARRWLAAGDQLHDRPVRIDLVDGLITGLTPIDAGAPCADVLAMPALANAHDHGRGLRPLTYGAVDQALETWFTALNIHPKVDPYLNAAVAFARMARSASAGVSSGSRDSTARSA